MMQVRLLACKSVTKNSRHSPLKTLRTRLMLIAIAGRVFKPITELLSLKFSVIPE